MPRITPRQLLRRPGCARWVTAMVAPDSHRGSVVARLRLDKWLWAARFYKTRGLAVHAIEAGQVRLNGERVKAAHVVREGDNVTVRKQAIEWEVEIAALSDRRGSPADAAAL